MNQNKPPAAAQTLNAVKEQRKRTADYRDGLLSQVKHFEKALEDHLKDWTEDTDPVTKQPFAIIESIKEDGASWGRRILLFNGHSLDYLIRDDGALIERTGAHNRSTLYDQGFEVPTHPKESIHLRKTSSDRSVVGVALSDQLDEFLFKTTLEPVRGVVV
jgi:hypothetical protein